MEQKIYDVLCDIRTELSNLRSDMSDIKLELEGIQGDDDERVNLSELLEELTDIKSDINNFKKEYKKRMDGLLDEDAEEGALYTVAAIHDRLLAIEMTTYEIKSMYAAQNRF
jgi:hypothetical protein